MDLKKLEAHFCVQGYNGICIHGNKIVFKK